MPNFDKIVDLLNEVEKDILISLVVQFPLCYVFLTFYVDGFMQYSLFDKVIFAVAIDVPPTLLIALLAVTCDKLIGVKLIKYLSVLSWAAPVSFSAICIYYSQDLCLWPYSVIPILLIGINWYGQFIERREKKLRKQHSRKNK